MDNKPIIPAKVYVLSKGYHRMTLDIGNTYSDGSFHKGIDLTGNPDVSGGYDSVLAIAAGKVITAGWHKDCGYWVRIDHGNGIISRYMHMKKGSLKVKVGDYVKQGQIIGYMGSTGNSTARHLHFDISIGGTDIENYVDPKPYIAGTKTISSAPSTGNYIVTGDVNVRKGAGSGYDRIFYKDFTANAKAQVKAIDKSCPDHFPKGIKLTISQVKQASNGVYWGKCPTGWVCMSYLKAI